MKLKHKTLTEQKRIIVPAGSKRCSACKRIKVYASFNKDKGVPDGYNRQCRVCRIRTQQKSKKKYLRTVDALKKNLSCTKCGEKRTSSLDFHHRDPATKVDSISNMRDQQRPLKEIRAEIKKCTVLCSNCHRELHHLKRTTEEYLKGGIK